MTNEISTDSLHQELQAHIRKCGQCSAAADEDKSQPRPFGKPGRFCASYYQIVELWSEPTGDSGLIAGTITDLKRND